MSLYQKYRPQQFDSLSGQDHIKKSLKNALKKGVVAHAYLFCGPRGTGKTTSARLIAKSLNCTNFNKKTSSPCNECDICLAINNGSLIDVIEIDAASNRGIDEIRELKETIRFAPTNAENKIYIVDEVHMLTNEAFNALLKTLEEPPKNVYFILATTEVHKVPETIISRCQRFDFRRIPNTEIIERLKFIAEQEKFKYDQEALEMIAIHSNGGLRDAISLLDQIATADKITAEDTKKILGSSGIDTIYSFINFLLEGNDAEAFKIIHSLQEQGVSTKQFEADVIKIAREKLHLAIEKNDLNEKSCLIELIQLWQEISNNFHSCSIPELPLEVLTVRFCNQLSTPTVTAQPIAKIDSKKTDTAEIVVRPKKIDSPKNEAASMPASEPTKVDISKNVQKSIPTSKPKTPEKDTEVSDNTVASIDLNIEKDWKKIVSNISIPTLRITLKNTKITVTEPNTVHIVAFSNFDYENLKKTENIDIIEKLLLKETSKELQVKITKDVVKLNSLNEDRKQTKIMPQKPVDESGDVPYSTTSANFDVLDMFEGELVE